MIHVNQNGAASSTVASTIRQLGIEVPDEVTSAQQRYGAAMKQHEVVRKGYDEALLTLSNASESEFDAAYSELVERSVHLKAVQDGVQETLIYVAGQRLDHSVYDAAPVWELEVVKRFNATVDHYELNSIAHNLPALDDPNSFNILNLSAAQGEAVDRWRTAATNLNPLWAAYQKLAQVRSHHVGPSANKADNLFLACVLGDPGTFATADVAALRFAEIAAGTSNARPYAPINPFVVPARVGYDLLLHSIRAAEHIRAQI